VLVPGTPTSGLVVGKFQMITNKDCPVFRAKCGDDCAWYHQVECDCRLLLALERFADAIEIRQHQKLQRDNKAAARDYPYLDLN
jgi:hypothetical protein